MSKPWSALALAVYFALGATVSTVGAVDITTCGVEIPQGETGTLQDDLDCTNALGLCLECTETGCAPGTTFCSTDDDCDPEDAGCSHLPGVTVRKDATLDMNGHAINAGVHCAVRCLDQKARCTILSSTGRGDVTGGLCIQLSHRTRLDISDVDVHDCDSGIASLNFSAFITANDVTSNNNDTTGVSAGKLIATDLTANDNGDRGLSVELGYIRGTNITVMNNGGFGAVSGKPYKITGFTAIGNGTLTSEGSGAGLWGKRNGKLTDSTLTNNVYQDAGGPIPMDLLTGKPKLTNTTCGRSGGHPGLYDSWGVCAND